MSRNAMPMLARDEAADALASPQRDRWLSLVTSPMPDISEGHARRILERERPSEFILPEDAPSVF